MLSEKREDVLCFYFTTEIESTFRNSWYYPIFWEHIAKSWLILAKFSKKHYFEIELLNEFIWYFSSSSIGTSILLQREFDNNGWRYLVNIC